MTDLTKFFGSTLPAARVNDLAGALGALSASKRAGSGSLILKLTKTGDWVFGPDAEVVEEGARLTVDPASFEAGYIAWHQGAVEGERMWPLYAMPDDPGSQLHPVQSRDGWQAQLGFRALFDGIVLSYKTSSLGGTDAIKALAGRIAAEVAQYAGAYPVIELRTDSYKHKQYGVIYKPMLPLVDWVDAEGRSVVKAALPAKRGAASLL